MAGGTFVFVGGYRNLAYAQADYELVNELHEEGLLGTYDAAIVIKRADGMMTVTNDTLLARHGAWTGLAVGALLGIIFPPSIVGAPAVGGVAGGGIGHLWRGMSRGDVKELGEALDAGQSALIVIGENRLADVIDAARLRTVRQVEKEIDADDDELKRELEAARQVA